MTLIVFLRTMIFPHTSLHFKLVPVQCRGYEYGLLLHACRTGNHRDINLIDINPDSRFEKNFNLNSLAAENLTRRMEMEMKNDIKTRHA